MLNTCAIIEPQFLHGDYPGDGDYEFTVIFHPEPPSPRELIKRGMEPEQKTVYPEEHFPEGFEPKEGTIFGLTPNDLTDYDHDHIISGGLPGSGMGIGNVPRIGAVPMTPDELMPQVPEMPGMSKPDFEAANNPQGLAGNPQFRPNLPGNIARALRQPEVINKISGQSGKGKERRDPEDEIPKDVRKRCTPEE